MHTKVLIYRHSFATSMYTAVQKIELSERIARILEYYDMSAMKFAKECKVSYSSIVKYMRGERKEITADVAERILDKFPNLSTRFLYSGKGEMIENKDYVKELERELNIVQEQLEVYRKLSKANEQIEDLKKGKN